MDKDPRYIKAYDAVLGEKNHAYYAHIFEGFEQHGQGLKISWNWSAFLFTGVWVLYRKMYVWFAAWLALTVLVGNAGVVKSQSLAMASLVITVAAALLFGVYANSLYYLKIKSKISNIFVPGDVLRQKPPLNLRGVNSWVPIVFGGFPIIGIIAAFALPAFFNNSQNKAESKREITESPVLTRHESSTEIKNSSEYESTKIMQSSIQTLVGKTHASAPPIPKFTSTDERLQYLRWMERNSSKLIDMMPHSQMRGELLQTVWYESKRAGLEPNLVLSLISNLTGFRNFYVGDTGARGLMAVSNLSFEKIGNGDAASLFQVQVNLRYGCVVLRHYLDQKPNVTHQAILDYVANSFGLSQNDPRAIAIANGSVLDASKWE